MWDALESIATFIGAAASLVAAAGTIWLLWQQRPQQPRAVITAQAVPGQPEWFDCSLQLVNRSDVPMEGDRLKIEHPKDALLFTGVPPQGIPTVHLSAGARIVDAKLYVAEVGSERTWKFGPIKTDRDHMRFLLRAKATKAVNLSFTLSLNARDQTLRKTTISIRAVARTQPETPII